MNNKGEEMASQLRNGYPSQVLIYLLVYHVMLLASLIHAADASYKTCEYQSLRTKIDWKNGGHVINGQYSALSFRATFCIERRADIF